MLRHPLAVPVLVMTTLACMLAPGTASAAGCRDNRILDIRELIETGRILEDSAVFERVRETMSLSELVATLGPASRDVGSGLHIFIWEARDGSTLRASAGGRCDRLMRFDRTRG